MAIDPRILAMIDEVDGLRKSRTDHMQIPRIEGEMLYHIALVSKAKLIVEVGTSYGFSGLWWGAALKQTGGKLHTIDALQKKFDSAKETFAKVGLADVVVNHLGNGRDVLPTIPGPIDLAFIDADKPSCVAYFDLIWPKLRAGGSVLTDNVTSHPDLLKDYVSYVRARTDASSIEVPVGNGVEWTVKVK